MGSNKPWPQGAFWLGFSIDYHTRIYIAERTCFAKGYSRRHTYMRWQHTDDVEITGFIFHTESGHNFVGLKKMQA